MSSYIVFYIGGNITTSKLHEQWKHILYSTRFLNREYFHKNPYNHTKNAKRSEQIQLIETRLTEIYQDAILNFYIYKLIHYVNI